jgi:peroxiredoxin
MPVDTPPPGSATRGDSYEELLGAELGADAVQATRVALSTSDGLGDPQAALRIGARAPAFTLADQQGRPVTLTQLLVQGPLVAIFYRGGWCPFCNVHLRAFQLARPHIRALGATVALISPQLPGFGRALANQHGLLFPVLSDAGNQVARQYGLVFQMPAELRKEYLADGVDLETITGDPRWEVPMPATFVIDRDGIIRYAFVSADYTRRAEPSDVIATLRALQSARTAPAGARP